MRSEKNNEIIDGDNDGIENNKEVWNEGDEEEKRFMENRCDLNNGNGDGGGI